MIKEFEGKTEEDAINNAIEALGLSREDIDIEKIEPLKSGFLFRGGKVKIRVHFNDDESGEKSPEEAVKEFLDGLLKRMGLSGDVRILEKNENKVKLDIISNDSGIIIGKQGKTLDAIQLITNIVTTRNNENIKVIIDSEDYRRRREQSIIQFAKRTAIQVRKTKNSKLLDPMNPFERRLVHTALSSFEDIETISEGEGLYKQVRILYRGNHNY
ncbi:MAG: protein jag [Spirochaetales bacterium]|nr:protein jag [Spirochaetales bacterium]